MYIYSNFNNRQGGIGCLIFGILGVVALYYMLRGLFYLLAWAAPVLLVLALVINWRAVADTGKDFLALLERNPLAGLLMGFLGVVGFPVLTLYLVVKALGYNKLKEMQQQFGSSTGNKAMGQDEFVEFEELESTPKGKLYQDEPIELEILPEEPEPTKATKAPEKPKNPYDTLFEG
jgi:hypothetical protein